MDQPKIERLLRLMMLLTSNKTYTIDHLADQLNMSPRTVYRYIDTFKSAGFIIKKTGNDIYRIDKSSHYFKDISQLVHFTEEEAYLLKNAIDSITPNLPMALELKKKLATVYDYKILANVITQPENSRNITLLSEAINTHKQVRLENYRSSEDNKIYDCVVEPFEFTTNFVQIWCYEPSEHQNKLYHVARITSVEMLPESWQYESEHHKGKTDMFNCSSDVECHVKLQMSIGAAERMMDEFPLTRECLHLLKNHCLYEFEGNVRSLYGIGRFIVGSFYEIWILEPIELTEHVNEVITYAYENMDSNVP